MAEWALRLQGVGNAFAPQLGSAMATIERDSAPWLTIDCGAEGLAAYLHHYGRLPQAIFVTHTHWDHIGGFETLFTRAWLSEPRTPVRVYAPVSIIGLLHQRVGDYPNALAEGKVNFWDAFHLIPISNAFWHCGIRLEAFPVRHHWPETAFGLRVPGTLVWTGDTRPIPEMLAQYADHDELIAHDCGLEGNPSHTGIDDIEREYTHDVRARLLLYHYASAEDGDRMAERGYRVARPGQRIALTVPLAERE